MTTAATAAAVAAAAAIPIYQWKGIGAGPIFIIITIIHFFHFTIGGYDARLGLVVGEKLRRQEIDRFSFLARMSLMAAGRR